MLKAIILLAQGFEEIEAVTPMDLLRRAGMEVTVAGVADKLVQGARGVTIQADALLREVLADDYDVCVLPGGMPGAKHLAASPEVKSLVLKLRDQGKLIAAICAAPAVVLFPWGLLNQKRATCFPGLESHFDDSVTFEGKNVVRDGNIVTSRGAGTAFAFSLAVIEALTDPETAAGVAQKTLYRSPDAG
jgi:4-methyl-5(b-hydroxyethyl)-thiazole monophosphate biosynthesis